MTLLALSSVDTPATTVVWALAVIVALARIGGSLAVRAGQPAVLGELLVGVLLGNLRLVGMLWVEPLKTNPNLDVLAQLGVIILLFDIGVESTVREMMKVGLTATLVAVLGVVVPFALGWGVGALILPGHSAYAHAFLGATLTATSIGITARVLGDLGKERSSEAHVILGAAVIDDVLGLIILAVVTGVIEAANSGATLALGAVGFIVGKAALFLFGATALGMAISPKLFGLAARVRGQGVLLATALVFCFGMSYLAAAIGLAAIVGAYAAGLILEEVHFRAFKERGDPGLREMLQPISTLLAPVFFVLMGMHVDLSFLGNGDAVRLAALLTVAAIVGKQACSLGALGTKLDRLTIGLGMIPRGEVGLIFANLGMGLTVHGERVVDAVTYSAVVIMVLVTTMVTPPALRLSLRRAEARR